MRVNPRRSIPILIFVLAAGCIGTSGAQSVRGALAPLTVAPELLDLFRAHYAGDRKSDIALLRQPYNMLVLKVLTLVQDGDPPLARTIASSREAIWTMLADPVRFSAVI